MRTQKKTFMLTLFVSLFLSGSIFFGSFQARAEEWTEEQKEVWKTVEARWELIIKGDAEALAENLHNDALIWWPQNAYPSRKEAMEGQFREWFRLNKPLSYELKPVAINIVGNISTAFFYFKWESKVPPNTFKGRNFQVFLKQAGRWKMLGDSSSLCDGSTYCY